MLIPLLLLLPSDATAGQGWYLLRPPWTKFPTATETGQVDSTEPLSQWGQESAFETAQECERERNTAKAKAFATVKASQEKSSLEAVILAKLVASRG